MKMTDGEPVEFLTITAGKSKEYVTSFTDEDPYSGTYKQLKSPSSVLAEWSFVAFDPAMLIDGNGNTRTVKQILDAYKEFLGTPTPVTPTEKSEGIFSIIITHDPSLFVGSMWTPDANSKSPVDFYRLVKPSVIRT